MACSATSSPKALAISNDSSNDEAAACNSPFFTEERERERVMGLHATFKNISAI
jgi:hypothetical protein